MIEGLGATELSRTPENGKWTIHQHVAHLTRHHEVMLGRIERIRTETSPHLDRYKAESDAAWPSLAACSTEAILALLHSLRRDLIAIAGSLSADEWARVGIHPVLGPMNLGEWLDFFLLHEAHHLYTVRLLAGPRRAS